MTGALSPAEPPLSPVSLGPGIQMTGMTGMTYALLKTKVQDGV